MAPRSLKTRPTALAAIALVMLGWTQGVAGAAQPLRSQPRQVYTCRLRATSLPNTITLTFRLDSTIAGRRWHVRIRDNGEVVYSRVRITNSEGDLRARKTIENRRGPDRLVAKARDQRTGDLCKVTFRV